MQAGGQRDFENVGADIRAAIDVFTTRTPAVRRVVLWGLYVTFARLP